LSAERVLNPTRPLLDSRDSHWLFVMGRFQPAAATEAGRAQARTQLTHHLQTWLAAEGGTDPDVDTRRRIERSYIEFTPAAAASSFCAAATRTRCTSDGDHRAGAGDRVRQSGESAAGARNGRAPAKFQYGSRWARHARD